MGEVSYLRLPHLSGELLCFVAEDDLWLAPLDGPGRAWRLTVDRTKIGHPRFSPAGRKLPWGPVSDIQAADLDGERRTLLLTGTPPHEPAAWKRYRGGATGRLWLHGERLLPDLDGHLACPVFVAGRIAFLSDHEGV